MRLRGQGGLDGQVPRPLDQVRRPLDHGLLCGSTEAHAAHAACRQSALARAVLTHFFLKERLERTCLQLASRVLAKAVYCKVRFQGNRAVVCMVYDGSRVSNRSCVCAVLDAAARKNMHPRPTKSSQRLANYLVWIVALTIRLFTALLGYWASSSPTTTQGRPTTHLCHHARRSGCSRSSSTFPCTPPLPHPVVTTASLRVQAASCVKAVKP